MKWLSFGLLVGIAWMVFLALPSDSIAEELTSHDMVRMRIVREAVISPDGSEIAYVLSVPRDPFEEEDGDPWKELHVVDGGGNSGPFVTGAVEVSNIAWTPDGSSISFLAKRDGDEHKSLYVIRRNGGEATRVLQHHTDIDAYEWNPDGDRVAFLAEDSLSASVRELRERGFDQKVFEEDWMSPKVWIAGVEEGDDPPRMLDLPGAARAVRWRARGDALAVALTPNPGADDGLIRRKLYVVDANSGKILTRIGNPGKLGRFEWSPSGQHIAFLSAQDDTDPSPGRLMVVPSDGGEVRDLLTGYEAHVRGFCWQADSIMYLADEGVWTVMGEVSPAGSKKIHIPSEGPILRSLSLSEDGLVAAFIANTPEHPNEVYIAEHGRDGLIRLTNSNPWLSEMEIAPQEAVSYSARDGLDLHGILIHPLHEISGEKYPLILVIHGGPEAHFRNGWVTDWARPGQVAAAGGFAVFYPNYRASTGRGVEFSKLDHGDPAGGEFNDIVDAIDHLVQIGLVDRSKVGITGTSYGGYASAWAATKLSEHFAASVPGFALSHLVSFTGTTDIPDEMYQVHFRKWPWEDWDFILDRSPIFHAGSNRTPTLIMTGEQDERVHPSQSLELYRYLKKMGQAPVRLVFYPEEKHGNSRTAHRLDYNLRLMRWMEHYLMGPGGNPPPRTMDYDEGGDDAAAEAQLPESDVSVPQEESSRQ